MIFPIILLTILMLGLAFAAWHAYSIDEVPAAATLIGILIIVVILALAGIL